MTALELHSPVEPLVDPFTIRPLGPVERRPRLLSYVGRWGRARRWLPDNAQRVLDVGCAFAYGSAAIAAPGRPPGRVVVGVEPDATHLAKAHERFPWITVLPGQAQHLPIPDGAADAVTLLDVIEHVDRAELAIEEARRVLRSGGVAIISVPHRGLLWRVDALNVYAAVRRRWPQLPPMEEATESGGHEHRHYSVAGLERLLAPHFTVDRVTRTGIGLQEFVTLGLMTLSVGLRQKRLTRSLQVLHLIVYVIDDLLPLGRFGYHLTVRAQAVPHVGGTSRGDAT
jgi:SAM-dependent methyltransferase